MIEPSKDISFDEKYLAAIDLGTAKIGLCVTLLQGDALHVVYYKEFPSEGIQSSQVLIPMKTAAVIKRAITDAEKELLIRIHRVVVGMPRNDVVQLSASASLQREDPDEYISQEEVLSIKARAIESFPLPLPDKQAIYGAVAQSFTIEDGLQLSERDVVGTLSPTLEGNFKVFVGRRKANDTVDKIFRELGIQVARKYFLPEVIDLSVLSKEEMKGGVALVDIGAGVTSVSIYREKIMRYYAAIPFGGNHVTCDIEEECTLDSELAERIKKRFGACLPESLGAAKDKILQIRLTDPYKDIPVRYIAEIVGARYREIMEAVLFHIQESGLQNSIRGGIVLTGGGAEQGGLEAMVREMSGCSVRKGYPKSRLSFPAGSSAYKASATSAFGMILAAMEDNLPDCATVPEPKDEPETIVIDEPTPANPEGILIPPESFGKEVTPPAKPSPSTRGGRKKPTEKKPDEEPKTGVLDLVWTKIETKLLKWYDDANK